jgi:hypothetical protein
MAYPSDRETAYLIDFVAFIDPALLALPTSPIVPDPPSFQPLSTTPDRYSRGLAAESWSPTDLRQEALGGDASINSIGHTSSNRRQQGEYHRRKFSHTTLTGSQYHFPNIELTATKASKMLDRKC